MLNRTLNYTVKNIEYLVVLFILAGIIAMNKTFAYIGINQIYITEFLLLITILSLCYKTIVSFFPSGSFTWQSAARFYLIQFWPLIILFLFAVTRLIMDLNYGMLAVRHSMILLYTIFFVFLFTFSIKNQNHLSFINIYLLIIFSSIFNGIKILIFKFQHITFNYYEQERVFHVETDTICSSVALLGLLVFHKQLLKKSRIGFIILIVLNVSILLLTVKRSAVLGMLPSLLIYAYLSRQKINIKTLGKGILISLLVLFSLLALLYFISPETMIHYRDYFLEKLSLKENNTSWRLQAWEVAIKKLKENLLWGIGYGPKILDYPINNVDTSDPHNSFLAFLVRHGIIISVLYLFFIVRTYLFIFTEIKSNLRGSSKYNNAVFICLGLTSLIIFAFFNVVLENQYEGIFFNFFLAGIYIIKSEKVKITENNSFEYSNPIGYGILLVSSLYISFSFSPFNRDSVVSIYSARTNSSLPILHQYKSKRIQLKSTINHGLSITMDSEKYVYGELFWFFPAQVKKEDFLKYKIIVETQGKQNILSYWIQYEDDTRIQLIGVVEAGHLKIPLDTLAQLNKSVKAKYLILGMASDASAGNIVVKNIYLSKK